MIRSISILSLLAVTLVSVRASGREFCTGDNCAPDVLAIHFGSPEGPTDMDGFNVGDEFTVWVVVRNVESRINAFSLGVAHDMDKLEIVDGSNSDEVKALNPFFENFSEAVGKGDELNGDPANDPTRFGFVATALLPVLPAPGVSLPDGETNFPLCFATFRVIADLSTPALIEIRNDMVPNVGAPATVVNYSVSGVSTPPAEVFDATASGGVVGGNCDATHDWGLYFGDDVTTNHTVAGNNVFSITMRNSIEALGCSLGVKIEDTNLSFRDRELGRDVGGDIRLVDLIITDNDGNTQTPSTNEATGPGGGLGANMIELGAAISAISDPFFQVNLSPDVGGPGFTIAYAADVSGSGATIPATGTEESCPTNEMFVVTMGMGPEDADFTRADVNGDDRFNITDGAIMAQNIFFARLESFDCDDMLDANDDGTLDMADPVAFLMWAFMGSATLGSPFGDECGQDLTNDGLGCNESNCR